MLGNLVLVLSIFSQTIFFSVFALFNYQSSPLYKIIQAVLAALSCAVILANVIRNKGKVRIHWGIFIIHAVIILHYFIVCAINNWKLNEWFVYYILWGFVPSMLALSFSRREYEKAIKYIEVLNMIQGIACIYNVVTFYLGGGTYQGQMSFGGETYQTISYLSAATVGISFYYMFFCHSADRFHFFKTKIARYMYLLIICGNCLTTMLSRGRGGAVLLVFYIAAFAALFWRSKADISRAYKLMIYLIFGLGVVYFIYECLHNPFLKWAIERTFSYFQGGKFDMTQTSFRDVLYKGAIEQWWNKPLLGYGPFIYLENNYPHNIFFELLVSGGVFYFGIGVYFIVKIIRKCFLSLKNQEEDMLISIVFLFSFIMLNFSSTFYSNAVFWSTSTYFLWCAENSPYEPRKIKLKWKI